MNPTKTSSRALLCCLIILTLCFASKAQVVAGIRANGRVMIKGDTINVCRGTSITYESLAQGSPLITWRFNNGTPLTQTGAGPFSIVYNTNGYDTTFQKVGSGAFVDSMFIIVRVFDLRPLVDYNFIPDNVCGNQNIQFNDLTTNGAPFSYLWTFDDGSTSIDQNPSHQFLSAVGNAGFQTFNVKLVVSNSSFCVDSVTKTVTIKSVPDAAVANADPIVTTSTNDDGLTIFKVCDDQATYNFKFTNQSSTTAGNVSYTISWGDGSADTTFPTWPAATVINHDYLPGPHDMTVSVTGVSGCVGIKKYMVYVGAFPFGQLSTANSNQICVADSMSFNVTGTSINSPGTTYFFYINDGTESQFYQHPIKPVVGHRFQKSSCSNLSSDKNDQVFNNAFGAYLLVQNPCGVNSASIVPIYVSSKPAPVINVSAPAICVNNGNRLINTSSYGNTITPSGGLDATCEQKGKKVWTITPATGVVLVSGSLGSLNGNLQDQAAWTNAADTLDLQYTQPGTYTVKLYVSNERCGLDSTTKTICVRSAPVASFMLPQKTSCSPVSFDLTNTSPVNSCDPADDEYHWTISYDDPEQCAVAGDPTFAFLNGTGESTKSPSVSFTAAGRYVIQLMVRATNSGTDCPPATFTDTFYVKGPLKAQVNPLLPVCVNNDVNPGVSLTSCYSKGPYTYQWSFQDGLPAASADSLPGAIRFATPGLHAIQLIITDNGCPQPVTLNATVDVSALPVITVIDDAAVCSGETITLGGAAVNGVTYQWTPVDGLTDPAASNPMFTAAYNGTANDTTIRFYVQYSQGANCTGLDSTTITVKRRPVITVEPATAKICSGNSITLNASGADNYSWSPDDHISATAGPSIQASPIATTTYVVTGTIVNGCAASDQVTVAVAASPVADFTVSTDRMCLGQPLFVTNKTTGSASYEWNWNDGSGASTFESGQHNFNAAGKYDVRLIAKSLDVDGFTCSDTSTKQVEVVAKIAAQINVTAGAKCAPYTFEATAVNAANATLVDWIIYDSSATPGEFKTTGPTATHVYNTPGNYTARLIVHSAEGCTDTAFVDFHVSGTPSTTFEPQHISVCLPDTTINFVATTNSAGDDAITYRWLINNTLAGTASSLTHHFVRTAGNANPEVFNITLQATNSSGCGEALLNGTVTLHPPFTTGIDVSPALVQQQPNYEFSFTETGIVNPNRTYSWTMGDRTGQVLDGQRITYRYGDTGTYRVSLLVRDFQTNCMASDSVTVAVLYIPGYVQVPNAICPGCSNQAVRQFLPLARGLKSYRLTIYTTLGQKVFETTSLDAQGSPNLPWDGTLNGRRLQQDVYSWQIEALFNNGTEWKGMLYPGKAKPVKAGFITVIK